jgi:hypothetical protein
MSVLQSTIFETQWPFKCACCDIWFNPGTLAYYDTKHQLRNGSDEHIWPDGPADDFRSISKPDNVEVMPRGKKASDRCDRCFQVPSNSGACGCE